jgi:hypothetical protein
MRRPALARATGTQARARDPSPSSDSLAKSPSFYIVFIYSSSIYTVFVHAHPSRNNSRTRLLVIDLWSLALPPRPRTRDATRATSVPACAVFTFRAFHRHAITRPRRAQVGPLKRAARTNPRTGLQPLPSARAHICTIYWKKCAKLVRQLAS